MFCIVLPSSAKPDWLSAFKFEPNCTNLAVVKVIIEPNTKSAPPTTLSNTIPTFPIWPSVASALFFNFWLASPTASEIFSAFSLELFSNCFAACAKVSIFLAFSFFSALLPPMASTSFCKVLSVAHCGAENVCPSPYVNSMSLTAMFGFPINTSFNYDK